MQDHVRGNWFEDIYIGQLLLFKVLNRNKNLYVNYDVHRYYQCRFHEVNLLLAQLLDLIPLNWSIEIKLHGGILFYISMTLSFRAKWATVRMSYTFMWECNLQLQCLKRLRFMNFC